MSTSITKNETIIAENVKISEEALTVDIDDGRTISVPLSWFPRLLYGSADERNNWRLIGRGEGIHWPDLDEDISITGLLDGIPSNESQESFQKWLKGRTLQHYNP